MSLQWLQSELLKTKVLKRFDRQQLDINDNAVPSRLRNSLISTDSKEASVDTSRTSINVVNGDRTSGEEVLSDDEAYEVARTCPDDCDHEDCPFQPRLTSSSEVFVTFRNPHPTPSSISLMRRLSSTSVMERSSSERNDFLRITRLVPLRNDSVILHWTVGSFFGIRGYKIFVDGFQVSTIFSAERTSAYISNIKMSISHLFSITIIPETNAIFMRNLSSLEPAFHFFHPL